MFRILIIALASCLPMAATQAQPEPPAAKIIEQNPWQDHGDYRVLISNFNSDFLQPATADALGLTRAANQAIINIAVTRKDSSGRYSLGLPAQVSGHSVNLMQQQKSLEFVEVAEQSATYYLAPVRITNEEVLHFSVTVQIDDVSLPIAFTRTFYVSD